MNIVTSRTLILVYNRYNRVSRSVNCIHTSECVFINYMQGCKCDERLRAFGASRLDHIHRPDSTQQNFLRSRVGSVNVTGP